MSTEEPSIVSDVSIVAVGILFLLGLLVLGVRLKVVQLDGAARYNDDNARQSVRRVRTDGARGRILDRRGRVLADNRVVHSIVVCPESFQCRTWAETVDRISNAVCRVAECVGRSSALKGRDISRHVNQRLPMPLTAWHEVTESELARFCEHADEYPGFECIDRVERVYPFGPLAAHAIGYVGRARGESDAGGRFNFVLDEIRGRSGLEYYYDDYLRGVPGELRMVVDARGFTTREQTVVEPRRGPDLRLTIDADVQRVVERQLEGVWGACAVIDPRDGSVLALASRPTFDPNDFVPVLRSEFYDALCSAPGKPLLNRATGGAYAPGSTFKPVTALAALRAGWSEDELYCCEGAYGRGAGRLRCTRTWGHGDLDLVDALKVSCNAYFCNLGCEVGTNAVCSAARDLGLGSRTDVDLPVDRAGVVPDDGWKMKAYGNSWVRSDLVQMSIGQGMLLASPLQMALVVGAIGTGRLATPRLNAGTAPVSPRRIPFSDGHLAVVREGMRRVAAEGTGIRGSSGLAVRIAGKTGTAEVGRGATRRKNTWFIAYAPFESPTVAVALVVENGESGGATAAPRVRNILASIFGESE